MLRHGELLRGGLHQVGCSSRPERLQAQRRAGASGQMKSFLLFPTGHQDEPGAIGDILGEPAQQLG